MKYFDTFTGIGGFTLAINQVYENSNVDRSQNGGSEEDKKGNEGQGLQSEKGKEVSTEKRPVSERSSDGFNSRPLCVGFSEIDKYAIQVYQKHFPKHKNYGDITKLSERDVPDHDLFVGGFPCQSFSIAGKRKGFGDTRGTLFFEIVRILRTKKPKHFILENVKGLLSHDQGNTFKIIISTLDELGYFVEWQVLNSKNFGVPQNRERVFIVGHLGGEPRRKVFPIRESNQKLNRKINKQGCANTLTGRSAGGQNRRGNYIVASRGRCLAPKRTEYGKKIRKDYEAGKVKEQRKNVQQLEPRTDGITNTLTSVQKDNLIAPCLHGFEHGTNGQFNNQLRKKGMIRRLTPVECMRLQGFPDNWCDGISDTQKYKCAGNAVTVNVVREIVKRLFSS